MAEPTSASEPPVAAKPRWPKLNTGHLMVGATVLALVVAVLLAGWSLSGSKVLPLAQAPKYPTKFVAYTTPCTKLMEKAVLQRRVMLNGREPPTEGRHQFTILDLDEVRDSLIIHMISYNKSVLCAPHLGFPLCYCVFEREQPVRLHQHANKPQREHYTEIINPRLIRHSSKRTRSPENWPECNPPLERLTLRFRDVIVGYENAEYEPQAEAMSYRPAASAQYMLEYLNVLPSHCSAKVDGAAAMEAYFKASLQDPPASAGRPQIGA